MPSVFRGYTNHPPIFVSREAGFRELSCSAVGTHPHPTSAHAEPPHLYKCGGINAVVRDPAPNTSREAPSPAPSAMKCIAIHFTGDGHAPTGVPRTIGKRTERRRSDNSFCRWCSAAAANRRSLAARDRGGNSDERISRFLYALRHSPLPHVTTTKRPRGFADLAPVNAKSATAIA